MISARGATPCNLMLSEVGRAHVAHAVPIVFQPAEVFKVWGAVAAYLRGALLSGVNVSIFRRTLSFSCTRRKVFKKIPAGFHREAQLYELRVPLFGVGQAFAVTYSLDAPIVEDPAFTFTQMPLKLISDATKLPATVVAAVLHDITRFVGEALFQGRLIELEFPGVALVRVKRDRVMSIFDEAFTAELLHVDTRKWPAVYAAEARELLLPRRPAPSAGGAAGNSARPGSAARPSSATPPSGRPASSGGSKAFQPAAPFVNAPAPAGRTFDEMVDLRRQEQQRKSRSASARASSASSARAPGVPSAALAGEDGGADAGGSAPLAVVYDESVPARHLSPRAESVYDMVMPHPQGGALSASAAPVAASQMPPAPMPRHVGSPVRYNGNMARPATATPAPAPASTTPPAGGAAPAVTAAGGAPTPFARPQSAARFSGRQLHPNTHTNIFGFSGCQADEAPLVSRKRHFAARAPVSIPDPAAALEVVA